ncbi:hypothetical protein N7462_011712 [Penicillium macrosclerotiorum]|uniref:uncharacterized protein n=1 Tax=Penicillium macrosclerotiorum TaxID=303699 RepID=UPI00254866F1|nr:uncharacterized protein N7462_011712 [Penicillium macrosclerotiorum]KAJ5662786.1 hypothetical protein N7462_011712 [Penicillium macrosclerotiorum]
MSSTYKVLVIGAGELGIQVLRCLVYHPRSAEVAVLLRPASLTSTNPSQKKKADTLRQWGIQFVAGDIVADSEQTLTAVFAGYDLVIGCTGFVSGKGTQLKQTRAVLAAGIPRYIPWQFGVDYDAIGRGSPQDVFDEQLDVRELLRSQSKTRWAIVSTGMFTSFLFEPSFGVVDLKEATVCALGSLENRVTVTTPEDIGRFTAEIVLGHDSEALFAGQPIFVGGDTLNYEEVAQIVEKVTQMPIRRTVFSTTDAIAALAEDPDNSQLKYQAVFGQGRGVAWELSATWNWQRALRATTAEQWALENLTEASSLSIA